MIFKRLDFHIYRYYKSLKGQHYIYDIIYCTQHSDNRLERVNNSQTISNHGGHKAKTVQAEFVFMQLSLQKICQHYGGSGEYFKL